jgi:hypothetical protein
MSAKAVAAIGLGSAVKIRGVRPRGADLVADVSLEASDGTTIVDLGPPEPEGDHKADKLPPPDGRKPMDAEGVVRHVLHGPKGEARGALLEDGRIVRMPARTAAALHTPLAPGQKLAARGDGTTNPLGTVIAAKEIGATLSTLRAVEPKKPGGPSARKPGKHDERPKKPEQAI